MTVDLYVDELFLINFLMDFLILFLVRQVMHYRVSKLRIGAAAAVGALWGVVAVVCRNVPVFIQLVLTYGVVSTLMVKLSFGLKKKDLLKGITALYLMTFLVAGAMNVFHQYTAAGAYIELLLRGRVRDAMPGIGFALLAAGIFFGARYGLSWLEETRKNRVHLLEVTMHYRGKEKTVTALLDTGNRLYEPVTKKPVHVVTYDALKDICQSVSSVIYIPFRSVGREDGMMPGIYLDEIEIRQEDGVRKIEKPLVAICSRPLSEDGQYQMLLHEE